MQPGSLGTQPGPPHHPTPACWVPRLPDNPFSNTFTSMEPPLAMLCAAQVLPADITETVEQHPRRGDLLEVSPAAPHHPHTAHTTCAAHEQQQAHLQPQHLHGGCQGLHQLMCSAVSASWCSVSRHGGNLQATAKAGTP